MRDQEWFGLQRDTGQCLYFIERRANTFNIRTPGRFKATKTVQTNAGAKPRRAHQ